MVATVDGRVPPGPRGNLLLGSLPEIRRENVHAFLDAWRRYGDTVRFRGPLTLYLLAHPDAVKQVLQDNAANYPRPPFVRDRLQAIVGGGLVGAEGAGWVRSRRMAQPAFRRHSLEGYGRQFVEATTEVRAELAKARMSPTAGPTRSMSRRQSVWNRDAARLARLTRTISAATSSGRPVSA